MSEQPGRYQRSASGMVGALVVTLLVIGGYVAFRALNRTDLDIKPAHVDYRAEVGYAQQQGARVVYPAALPAGWTCTHAESSGAAHPSQPGLSLSILTAGDDYVGFQQSPLPLSSLLTTYVDSQPSQAGPTDTRGVLRHWATWTDSGGDTALAGRWHGESLLVYGSASRADLVRVADSLTTARVSSGS